MQPEIRGRSSNHALPPTTLPNVECALDADLSERERILIARWDALSVDQRQRARGTGRPLNIDRLQIVS